MTSQTDFKGLRESDLNLDALRERVRAITRGVPLDEVYGAEWCIFPSHTFYADLRALLSSAEAREEAWDRISDWTERLQAICEKAGCPAGLNRFDFIANRLAALRAAETRAQQAEARVEELEKVANAARDLIVEGLRLTPDGLIVREKADRSDPHYRLCTTLEAAGLIPSRARQALSTSGIQQEGEGEP